jgi:cytochrome c
MSRRKWVQPMTRGGVWISAAAAIALAAALTGALAAQRLGSRREAVQKAESMTGGNVGGAIGAMRRLGCGACHEIPGMPDAVGLVGPPLSHMGSRAYIAGVMPNTPENMILWIRWPQGVMPKSAMPNMGASAAEARDIAAYLFALR